MSNGGHWSKYWVGYLVFGLLIGTLFWFGGRNYLEMDAEHRSQSSYEMATLSGYDSGTGRVEVYEINLFRSNDEPWGGGIAGTARHGDRVRVLRRSGKMALVKTTSGKQGWVSRAFIGE